MWLMYQGTELITHLRGHAHSQGPGVWQQRASLSFGEYGDQGALCTMIVL